MRSNITTDGYIFVYAPEHPNAKQDGYVAQHRLVMAQSLGRALTTDEHVHHINGKRDDNRPENLQVLTRREHRLRHLAEWRATGTMPTPARGERNHGAKLVADQVREIRQLHDTGMTQTALAVRFGVRQTTISNIVLYKNWRHI